jgi:hypothetical protein
MKHIGSILFILLTTTALNAKHVPKKVMYHYCTEVASAQYNVPLEAISAHMPVYKNRGFVVQGKIDHHDRYQEHFICRFDDYGKFDFIKKRAPKHTDRIKKRLKRVCKSEASVRWHTPVRQIDITQIKKIDRYRYEITLEDAGSTGVCQVNRNGYVNRFQTLNKRRHVPRIVQDRCIRKAASRWNIPLSYIEIDEMNYLGRGRYRVEVSSDDYTAECEIRANGIIDHFNTRRKRNWW